MYRTAGCLISKDLVDDPEEISEVRVKWRSKYKDSDLSLPWLKFASRPLICTQLARCYRAHNIEY